MFSSTRSGFLNSRGSFLIFLRMSEVLPPVQGRLCFTLSAGLTSPQSQLNMKQRMSPSAQISDFSVQVSSSPRLISSSSGEKNSGVPTRVRNWSPLPPPILEVPKSAILTTPRASTSILLGFRSRCSTLCAYMNSMPLRICPQTPSNTPSSWPPSRQSRSSRVPPLHSSITMQTCSPWMVQSRYLTMLGWFSMRRVWIYCRFCDWLQDYLMATGSRLLSGSIRYPRYTLPQFPDPRGEDLLIMMLLQRQQWLRVGIGLQALKEVRSERCNRIIISSG